MQLIANPSFSLYYSYYKKSLFYKASIIFQHTRHKALQIQTTIYKKYSSIRFPDNTLRHTMNHVKLRK